MKGKCPKFGLLFLHNAMHRFLIFLLLLFLTPFFFPGATILLAISSVKKAFHLLLDASHSGKTPELIKQAAPGCRGLHFGS